MPDQLSKITHLFGPMDLPAQALTQQFSQQLASLAQLHHQIIYVDAGLRWKQQVAPICAMAKHTTQYSVGDGDSLDFSHLDLTHIDLPQEHLTYQFCAEKDFTDLSGALTTLTPPYPQQLHLWGFWGGRFDHHLAVCGDLTQWVNSTNSSCLCYLYHDDLQSCTIIAKKLQVHIDGLFSVVTLNPQLISITGEVAYQANNVAFTPCSGRGISNIGNGLVDIQGETAFMLIHGPLP